MQKEILKLIIFFLPVLALVLAINLYYDPGNLVGLNSKEEYIAKLMLEGKDVRLPKKILNFAPEKVYKYYFNSPGEKSFDVISIGSSRLMPLHSGAFPDQSYFNVSVGSCHLGDMLGLYRLIEKNNVKHKKIILGLGPNILMMPPYAYRKEILGPYFEEMLNILGFKYKEADSAKTKLNIEKYKELVSPRYFQKSGKLFIDSFTEEPITTSLEPIPSNDNPDGGVIHKDGSKNWSKWLAGLQGEEKEKNIIDSTLKQSRIQMAPKINSNTHIVFVKFIEYLKNKKGIEVEFLLPPYHPIAHDLEIKIRAGKSISSEEVTEAYVRQIAKEWGIKVIGSHNPYKVNIEESDMVDHHHPTRSFMQRIFEESYSKG